MASEYNQDTICDNYLKQKQNGFFVDIGGSFHEQWNNSFFFEKVRNYRGFAIDLNPEYTQGWIENRPQTKFIIGDATTQDYQKILDDLDAPTTIDFLSIDIDPRQQSLAALYKIFSTSYNFSTIAFEVDAGQGSDGWVDVRDESRKFLKARNFILAGEIFKGSYHVDDIWVHKSIYDIQTLKWVWQ